MTTQRYVYAAVIFALTLLASATSAGLLSPHYAAWAGVVGASLTGVLTVLRPGPDAVSKAADLVNKGGAGLMCLALLVGCQPTLTPADEADIAGYDRMLAECRGRGLDAGKDAGLAVYRACVASDGGKP